MRKPDLALSLGPRTSVENLMSWVEVWPHLPGKHLQACKADTMIPVMSPSNHSQRTCRPNSGYTLKFQEITPSVGTSGTGWNMCPCTWKANALLRCREQCRGKGRTGRVAVALWLQMLWRVFWRMVWASGYFEGRGSSVSSQILVINFVFKFCLTGLFNIYFEKSTVRMAAAGHAGCSADTMKAATSSSVC